MTRAVVTCALAGLAACSAGPPGPGVDVDRALGHVAALTALGPHPGDSPGAQRAARYIEGELAAIGLRVERMPVGTVTIPAIDLLGTHQRSARTRVTTDPDLIVRLGPATGRAVLVMAHYDTVPASPGAVDNSAAVAVTLELARVLAAAPPPAPVMLAFTANEEIGLVGAEALAAQRAGEVAFAIALDLIGGSGELTLNGASRLIGRAELGWLARAADRAGVVVRAPLPHRVISRAWPQAERSDHGPFTRRGTPAVHFYHRGQDGERIDLAYHSARDTAARVDRRSVDEIGRLLRAITEGPPPPPHDGDGFWPPVAVNLVVPRALLVGLDLALAALALGVLATLRTPRARGGVGLGAGAACFLAAGAATALVERLAAGDHAAPWLHAPGAAVVAELALLLGSFGLLTRLARRFAPWVGAVRYLAVAIALPLAVGLGCLFVGAAELAWIWLVPAAACAIAPRLGRFGGAAIAAALLPGVLVLAPDQLREAAWNGFLPTAIPLAAWIAGVALAPLATLAWWVRRSPPPGPLGTFVLPVGCGLAIILGIVATLGTRLPCTSRQFHDFSLACEVMRPVR
ncbi:MAG TPA: M28 family metallopeptidase [Kofleriaceae bacterium]|nr:M28 family metallopeptidase [Kofleriaceae bacterium]